MDSTQLTPLLITQCFCTLISFLKGAYKRLLKRSSENRGPGRPLLAVKTCSHGAPPDKPPCEGSLGKREDEEFAQRSSSCVILSGDVLSIQYASLSVEVWNETTPLPLRPVSLLQRKEEYLPHEHTEEGRPPSSTGSVYAHPKPRTTMHKVKAPPLACEAGKHTGPVPADLCRTLRTSTNLNPGVGFSV